MMLATLERAHAAHRVLPWLPARARSPCWLIMNVKTPTHLRSATQSWGA